MLKILSLSLTAVFLIAGVTLGVLNPQAVAIDLLWFQWSLPLSVVMAALFIAGMLLGAGLMLLQLTRMKWRLLKQRRDNQKLMDEVLQLKKSQVSALTTLEKNRSALINKEN
ncbi:lipopolysaccharide assembly protein LapA domain-containing protein [Thiomicrorhabdus cannonii]|uniref:lipopolysaccharide assembly protein LapA domain-containing protein n=1 Tax=Thiomicrorhabdus cannonii TaxID=2748011 RepID=UPI0015BA791C|nr:LapA family protein [Thiomicrorhabdus cannonii]